MVLLIENKILDTVESDLLISVLNSDYIVSKASHFTQISPISLSSSSGKIIHTSQREKATVMPDNVDYLGSSEATSCHIVFLRSSTTSKAVCAHVDSEGSTNESFKILIDSFSPQELSQGIEVSIFGGFCDEHDRSVDVAIALLEHLHASPHKFHLLQACILTLNNHETGKAHIMLPIITSVAMHVKDGSILPVKFSDDSKGPEQALRNGRFTCDEGLTEVFDIQNNCLTLKPFRYSPIAQSRSLLKANDQDLLDLLSTTPHAESENFTKTLRDTLQFWIDNPEPNKYFEDHPNRTYHWDQEAKTWKQN